MPALNPQRRDALTDAAIEVLASSGAHGLSHRAVDERAGVPAGTTSNYFRSRDALLTATAERILRLHFSWVNEIRAKQTGALDRARLIEIFADVLDQAIRKHGKRHLAMLHLSLESTYRPELRDALSEVTTLAHQLVQAVHIGADTIPSDQDAALLQSSYIGLLFSGLVVPGALGDHKPRDLARSMLSKVLPQESQQRRTRQARSA